MLYPSLKKLPLPPSGKKSWPWTKESKPLSPVMSDGKPWPKISIVTPSYNQGQFLEETIRSVLLQNYPNFEYIIMDGGSTDNSVKIIKQYEKFLTYWISENDKGQADAIYRGFKKTSGDIIAWINSDDYYLQNAFKVVSKFFKNHQKKELLIGGSFHADIKGEIIKKYYGFPQKFESLLISGMHFNQPACFWRRESFFAVDGFDRSLQCCFDYDMFLRLTNRNFPGYTNNIIAVYRCHGDSKTSTIADVVSNERKKIRNKHGINFIDDILRLKMLKKSHLFIQLYKRLGLLLDLIMDPKWFYRETMDIIGNRRKFR